MGTGKRGGEGGSRWRRGVRCVTQLQQLCSAAGEVCTGNKYTPRGRARVPVTSTSTHFSSLGLAAKQRCKHCSVTASSSSRSLLLLLLPLPPPGLQRWGSLPAPSSSDQRGFPPPFSPSPSLPAVVVVIKVVVVRVCRAPRPARHWGGVGARGEGGLAIVS